MRRRVTALLMTLAIMLGGLVATGGAAEAATTKCPKAARVCVDLTHDRAWIQVNGKLTYHKVVMSSGRNHYRTPTGWYRVRAKQRHGYSRTFKAQMPYSVFFNGGIAFHQGDPSVNSHGCIHLHAKAAKYFYNHLHVGNRVYVFGRRR